MTRPSLAIYLPSLASGGAERLHIILAPAFIAAGYDVTFVLHQNKGSYADNVPAGVRVITLGCPRTLSCLGPLIKFLRKEKPDIMISNLGAQQSFGYLGGSDCQGENKSHRLSAQCAFYRMPHIKKLAI